MTAPDPRLTPMRASPGRLMRVVEPYADLRRAPSGESALETQLLFGEHFTVFEEHEGWAYGQAACDSYVGHAPAAALMPARGETASHVLAVRQSLVFPRPDLKSVPLMSLSLGALLTVTGEDARFARISQGFVPAVHLAPLSTVEPDVARTAETLLGAPYLWGGRTSAGLDCSALVQLIFQRAGTEAPRDADQQEEALGADLGPDPGELKRGDLVFWDGHVGLMLDPLRLIHANIFHMAVAIEPLAVARARIQAAGLPVKRVKRVG